MVKTILVVAAHPDDEVIGCGGTIARHVAEGDVVHVIFMADGVSSRMTANNNDLTQRNESAENAANVLGIYKNHYFGLPDNRMDTVPFLEIVKKIEGSVVDISPNIIYTHHHGDLNIDHKITNQAVMTACRPMPASCINEIYAFEVVSSTEWAIPSESPFTPNYYVEITDYMPKKSAALDCYLSEMRCEPHSRSKYHIDALSKHRGSTVGVLAAEAFVSIRTVRKI